MRTDLATLLSFVLLGCGATGAPAAARQERPPLGDPWEHGYDAPFFPGAEHDAGVPDPAELLRQPVGSRIAHHAEVLEAFRRMAEASPRARLETYARSHEGRELVWCAISTPENLARLDAITADLSTLHDPRGLSDADAERILTDSPAVAWLGYSIHGDEVSGSDASMAVAHHLITGTGDDVRELLEQVVVVIDPMQNPDGRERVLGMIEQSAGRVPSLDYASLHRGRWPWGRGNHYLFDMNRDWMLGTQPETRGRWAAIQRFRPQLLIDAHEMGALDTFLFYPQAAPHNPNLPETLGAWQGRFADDAGRAFDARGWAYYTREWADAWYPGYTDSWGSLVGAIGILYEQAGLGGQPLLRESGAVMTYRESVHHQVAASMANLDSLRANREAVLRDYLATGRRNVDSEAPGNDRAFVIRPGRQTDREVELRRALALQGIWVERTDEVLKVEDAVGPLGERAESLSCPPETLVVRAAQPQGALVRAFLELDPRMDAEYLREEREQLERTGTSKVYDVTAWSLLQALDLDAWWCTAPARELRAAPAPPLVVPRGPVGDGPSPGPYWVVDGADDRSVAFAARALERGLAVHVADVEFTADGRAWPRGSLLLRSAEQPKENARDFTPIGFLAELGHDLGLHARNLRSGRSPDEGPDLGGQHFRLLRRPRAAIVANDPIDPERYGELWHHLDTEVGLPLSILDAAALGRSDLRRFNVVVVPAGGGDVVTEHAEALGAWVDAGGTLVLVGNAAAAACAPEGGIVKTRLRRDVLKELDAYRFVAERELATRDVEVDPAVLYGDVPAPSPADEEGADEAPTAPRDPDAARQDAWQRRFAPRGAILRAEVDPEHWIAWGASERMPVHVEGDHVLLAPEPGWTPLRLADEHELRLGGLLWPEARERLALSGYVVVEPRGLGQVVLFHSPPAFRGMWKSTARLLAQAVVYGPGLGASQPLGR